MKNFADMEETPEKKLSIFLTCQVVATIGRPSVRNTEVCGTDGLTYKNVDSLKSARTETRDLELLYYGACDYTIEALRDFDSKKHIMYCGSDNKTYDQYLELLLQKLKTPGLFMKHSGPCEDKADRTSLRTVDSSVCAADFRTYDIEEYESAVIVYPGLRILHMGQCIIPMLYKLGYIRCAGCHFGLNYNVLRNAMGEDVSSGGGGKEAEILAKNLNQLANGVYNIIGGSVGALKYGLDLIRNSGCFRNCVVHG